MGASLFYAPADFITRGVFIMCEMGGMLAADYAYLIGLLGVVCGLLFCMGLNQ